MMQPPDSQFKAVGSMGSWIYTEDIKQIELLQRPLTLLRLMKIYVTLCKFMSSLSRENHRAICVLPNLLGN